LSSVVKETTEQLPAASTTAQGSKKKKKGKGQGSQQQALPQQVSDSNQSEKAVSTAAKFTKKTSAAIAIHSCDEEGEVARNENDHEDESRGVFSDDAATTSPIKKQGKMVGKAVKGKGSQSLFDEHENGSGEIQSKQTDTDEDKEQDSSADTNKMRNITASSSSGYQKAASGSGGDNVSIDQQPANINSLTASQSVEVLKQQSKQMVNSMSMPSQIQMYGATN